LSIDIGVWVAVERQMHLSSFFLIVKQRGKRPENRIAQWPQLTSGYIRHFGTVCLMF